MFAFNEHLVTGVDCVSAILWEIQGRTEALSPGHPVFPGLVVKLRLMLISKINPERQSFKCRS